MRTSTLLLVLLAAASAAACKDALAPNTLYVAGVNRTATGAVVYLDNPARASRLGRVAGPTVLAFPIPAGRSSCVWLPVEDAQPFLVVRVVIGGVTNDAPLRPEGRPQWRLTVLAPDSLELAPGGGCP